MYTKGDEPSSLPENTKGAMPLNLLIELWEKLLGEYDPLNPPNMYGETIQDTIFYLKNPETNAERIQGRTDVVEWLRWHGGIMDFITMHHEEEWQSMIAKWDINP